MTVYTYSSVRKTLARPQRIIGEIESLIKFTSFGVFNEITYTIIKKTFARPQILVVKFG